MGITVDKAKKYAERALYGTSRDGTIAYTSSAWRWIPLGGVPETITTVAGKWTVSGSTLRLHRPQFQFRDVTVPEGASLVFGRTGVVDIVQMLVSGILTVDGTLRAETIFSGHRTRNGARKSSAGAGNPATWQSLIGGWCNTPSPSGSGGGSANFAGGSGYTVDTNRPHWIVRQIAPTAVAGSTTTGTTPAANVASPTVTQPWASAPRLPGADGFPGGSGALSQTATGSYGGAGGAGSNASPEAGKLLGAFGGGVLDISARHIQVGTNGQIHTDGEAAIAAESGNASGADLTIAGGGCGGAGGGGGSCLIRYSKLTVNGSDRTNETTHADVTARIHSNGGAASSGGDGKTRLDSATALTMWAASTAYSLGTFRRNYVPESTTAIPLMTSNTAPSGVCFGSPTFGSYNWYKPFSANAAADYTEAWIVAGTAGHLGYQFVSPIVIAAYALTPVAESGANLHTPKSWTFEGSNNGTDWTTLDTRADITDWQGVPLPSVRKLFSFSNVTPYTYYRVNISQANEGSYMGLGKVEMFEASAPDPTVGFVVTTAGTSGSTQPTWPDSAGQTVTDGTVTWVSVAQGSNLTNAQFSGGNGVVGSVGVMVLERAVI